MGERARAEADDRHRIAQQADDESRRRALSRLGANRVDQEREQQEIGRDTIASEVTAQRELQQHQHRHDDGIAIAVGTSHRGGSTGGRLSCGTVNAFLKSDPACRGVVRIITCDSSAG